MSTGEKNDVTFTGSKNVLVSTENITFEEAGWCKRRSTLEKCLMVFSFIAFVAVIALVVVVLTNKNQKDKDGEDGMVDLQTAARSMCTTKECVKINDAIDYNIEPCDDFYDFACGNWKRKNVIPEDKSSYNSFTTVREDVNVILKIVLEEQDDDNDIEAVQKAKLLYRSCLNEKKLEDLGVQPVLDFIPMVGAWPVLSPGWTGRDFSLKDMLVKLAMYNNWPIIELSIYSDLKNIDTNILYIDQPSFGMPGRKYYLKGRNDTMVMAYETLAVKIATLLGANPTVAQNDMRDMVDFELLLANISVKAEDRRDSEKQYNKMTIAQLHQNYTQFDWLGYVQGIMSSPKVDITINDQEEVINYSPPYFEQLFTLLENTPNRTIANYGMWRIIMNRINYITKEFRDLLLDYRKVLYGTSTETARWKKCVSYVDSSLGKAVGKLFVREAFDEEAKSDMMTMIKNLKLSFEDQLATNEWMDDETRSEAKAKSAVIGTKIGFEDKILNDTHLNEYYANYTFIEGEYFQNVVNRIEENAAKAMRELRKPIDKTKWLMTPSAVNAYYLSTYNEIVFPAGILQPPFYHKNFPQSVNYGGIGMVIGHEITHGFDDQGRQYTKDGKLEDWWTSTSTESFKSKAECVINQYGDFTVKEADLKINGINTQGENIADNGGIKQSFQAYQRWVRENGEESKLPGLGFTPNQLFFLNFAQVWCSNARKEDSINRILTGVHSPPKFRVIGTLQNSPDFADSFSCKKSSYMNPVKKCKVW